MEREWDLEAEDLSLHTGLTITWVRNFCSESVGLVELLPVLTGIVGRSSERGQCWANLVEMLLSLSLCADVK